jgi:hypothetical protein
MLLVEETQFPLSSFDDNLSRTFPILGDREPQQSHPLCIEHIHKRGIQADPTSANIYLCRFTVHREARSVHMSNSRLKSLSWVVFLSTTAP